MKKKVVVLGLMCVLALTGCSKAERVSRNLSKEADNFNDVRQLTVINCLQNEIIFQMTGKLSIEVDEEENQLEVTVEEDDETYKKHFIGLSDNVSYLVQDITSDDVSDTKFTLNFNPDMVIPYEVETIE